MSTYSLTCPDIGCYTNFQCDPEFQNKVVAVAYVKKSAPALNKTTAALWKDSLLEAYLANNAFIVFNTSGEKPKPDTATTGGRGMQNTKALAKTHTVNYTDMQGVVQSNVQFYNDILSTSQNYDFYFFTPNRIWDASGAYVTVIGDPVISADLNTYQMAEVAVTWVAKTNPLPYEFDTDSFLEGLYFEVTPDDGAACVIVSSLDVDVLAPFTASLNIVGLTLTAGDPVWSVENISDPAKLSIDIVTPTGLTTDLSLNPGTGFGTVTFDVIAKTATGCILGSYTHCASLIA
jgi:hypothetical protein